jgi:hypothetical protein
VFLARLQYEALPSHGGRGRIRTSVARKERQIYSLLVLATHPPVLENPFVTKLLLPQLLTDKRFKNVRGGQAKTQNGLVSRDTSPSICFEGFAPLNSPARQMMELAEGIEPPTL